MIPNRRKDYYFQFCPTTPLAGGSAPFLVPTCCQQRHKPRTRLEGVWAASLGGPWCGGDAFETCAAGEAGLRKRSFPNLLFDAGTPELGNWHDTSSPQWHSKPNSRCRTRNHDIAQCIRQRLSRQLRHLSRHVNGLHHQWQAGSQGPRMHT